MARRPGRGQIVFMAVWLTLWTAGMLVVLWLLGGQALKGEFGMAPFLLLWLAFAAFGLYAGVRRLQTLLGLARAPDPAPTGRPHVWKDDLPPGQTPGATLGPTPGQKPGPTPGPKDG